MKILISWSGSKSKVMAEALRDWIPDVMQACEPWISSEDIDPGARWSSDLAKQLDEIQFGIICLTPENLNSPWIHFEAGAISKKLNDKARVCPYLLGIELTDITGPLTQFQAVIANRDDTNKLMQAINRALGNVALPDERFNRAFDTQWPRLDEILKKIPESTPSVKQPARKEKDMIEEILRTVREHSRILSELSINMQPNYQTIYNFSPDSLSVENTNLEDVLRFESDRKPFMIVDVLKKNGVLRFEDLKKLTGLSEKGLGNTLKVLRERNIVLKDEASRTYKLADEAIRKMERSSPSRNK